MLCRDVLPWPERGSERLMRALQHSGCSATQLRGKVARPSMLTCGCCPCPRFCPACRSAFAGTDWWAATCVHRAMGGGRLGVLRMPSKVLCIAGRSPLGSNLPAAGKGPLAGRCGVLADQVLCVTGSKEHLQHPWLQPADGGQQLCAGHAQLHPSATNQPSTRSVPPHLLRTSRVAPPSVPASTPRPASCWISMLPIRLPKSGTRSPALGPLMATCSSRRGRACMCIKG